MSEHTPNGIPSDGELVDTATALAYAQAANYGSYGGKHSDWPDCHSVCKAGVCTLKRAPGCCRLVSQRGDNSYGYDKEPSYYKQHGPYAGDDKHATRSSYYKKNVHGEQYVCWEEGYVVEFS